MCDSTGLRNIDQYVLSLQPTQSSQVTMEWGVTLHVSDWYRFFEQAFLSMTAEPKPTQHCPTQPIFTMRE